MLELVLQTCWSSFCQSFLRPFELVVRFSFERLSCVSEAERPRGRLTWLHPSHTNLARLKTNLPRSLARTHTHAGMAQFALGWRYASGIGCQQNDEMAVNLYRKAASRGITGTNAYLSCHHRYLECLEICTKRRNGCKSVAQSSEQSFSRATRAELQAELHSAELQAELQHSFSRASSRASSSFAQSFKQSFSRATRTELRAELQQSYTRLLAVQIYSHFKSTKWL